MTFENEEKDASVNNINITPKMQSYWATSLGWAIFLGLAAGVITSITIIFLGKSILRNLLHGDVYFNRNDLLDPYFIGFCLLLLISLIANFYQLRFAFQLKFAIKMESQAAFELAWLYSRNFAILFAVFILIITIMLIFSTVQIFTGY